MKVRALRTVYNRSEGREYEKGEVFETNERASRVLVKLCKVELITDAEPAAQPKQPRRSEQAAVRTADMKAESDTAQPQTTQRRYLRRDMRPEE